jgi:hypothetical protein
MSGGPVAFHWSRQARGRAGWVDVELVDLALFCCHACQADWLADHPGALDPRPAPSAAEWRVVGESGWPLEETDYDLWCAHCGVLIQLGLQEPPCPTWACPPLLVNRLPSRDGERCPACGRWQQLPTRLLGAGGGGP